MRILTPLIVPRVPRCAARDGDAMEVRGGTGYIEEWSDARIVRDAHLGSIWEGTSNIVALDVARARSEHALDALRAYWRPPRRGARCEPRGAAAHPRACLRRARAGR